MIKIGIYERKKYTQGIDNRVSRENILKEKKQKDQLIFGIQNIILILYYIVQLFIDFKKKIVS